MKGKLLSYEEIIGLENRSKVWVEYREYVGFGEDVQDGVETLISGKFHDQYTDEPVEKNLMARWSVNGDVKVYEWIEARTTTKETDQPKTYKGSEILAMIEDGILKDDDVIIDKEKDEWYVCDFKSDDNEKEVSCFILFEYTPFTIKQKPVDFLTAYNSHKKVKPEHGEYIFSDMKDYLEVIRNSNQVTADKLINGKWYIEQ